MDWVKIGSTDYKVNVVSITESFNILYSENTGRSIADGAPMVLDPLGTFYGHKITFRRKQGYERHFDALFDYISKPRYDGIPVSIVHGQTTLEYKAYISQGERKLERIDEETGTVYWRELSVNIIPMEAQVIPE